MGPTRSEEPVSICSDRFWLPVLTSNGRVYALQKWRGQYFQGDTGWLCRLKGMKYALCRDRFVGVAKQTRMSILKHGIGTYTSLIPVPTISIGNTIPPVPPVPSASCEKTFSSRLLSLPFQRRLRELGPAVFIETTDANSTRKGKGKRRNTKHEQCTAQAQ